MHIAAEPIELGDDDRRAVQTGVLERGLELRPALERVGALAGLDLLEGRRRAEALGLAEAGDCLQLRIETDIAGRPWRGGYRRLRVSWHLHITNVSCFYKWLWPIYFTVASRSAGPEPSAAAAGVRDAGGHAHGSCARCASRSGSLRKPSCRRSVSICPWIIACDMMSSASASASSLSLGGEIKSANGGQRLLDRLLPHRRGWRLQNFAKAARLGPEVVIIHSIL